MRYRLYILFFIIFWLRLSEGSAQSKDFPATIADSLVGKSTCILNLPTLNDKNTVTLQWQPCADKETGFYTIERSGNGTSFETLAVKKSSAKTPAYEFIDESPHTGNNYYRIKYTIADSVYYSNTHSIIVKGNFYCKFYPNPVDNLLIVKAEKEIQLNLADVSGKIWISKTISRGIQFVDVSNLTKGVYIITLVQKDENKWITDKLIKN